MHALLPSGGTSQCLRALQKPWLQAGTSRLLTSEVSATVADDIADLQQQGLSVSNAFLSPRPSRIGKLLNRYCFWLYPHDVETLKPVKAGLLSCSASQTCLKAICHVSGWHLMLQCPPLRRLTLTARH